jgi:hypothetical protein
MLLLKFLIKKEGRGYCDPSMVTKPRRGKVLTQGCAAVVRSLLCSKQRTSRNVHSAVLVIIFMAIP